jgi:hypothetical protein
MARRIAVLLKETPSISPYRLAQRTENAKGFGIEAVGYGRLIKLYEKWCKPLIAFKSG